MADLTCPKCQNAMEEGFTPDRTERSYGAVFLSTWFEGPPTTGFLRSIKLKGRRQLPISVYRCTSCGYLESYAYTAP